MPVRQTLMLAEQAGRAPGDPDVGVGHALPGVKAGDGSPGAQRIAEYAEHVAAGIERDVHGDARQAILHFGIDVLAGDRRGEAAAQHARHQHVLTRRQRVALIDDRLGEAVAGEPLVEIDDSARRRGQRQDRRIALKPEVARPTFLGACGAAGARKDGGGEKRSPFHVHLPGVAVAAERPRRDSGVESC